MIIKALTLYDPWAMLVALQQKQIETRSWYTDYRGLLAIHTSVNYRGPHMNLCWQEPFKTVLKPVFSTINGKEGYSLRHLGKVVAICNLVDCLYIARDDLSRYHPKAAMKIGEFVAPLPTGNELAFGDYTPGRFAWILSDIRRLETPIPAKGQRRLWNWDMPDNLRFTA